MSVTPLAAAGVAGAERVIWVSELIATIVTPGGMPVPETSMPTARPLVVGMLLTTGLPLVVVPVMAPGAKVSVTPLAAARVAGAERVIWVSELIATILAPEGMLVPETSMPTARPLVVGMLLTVGLPLVVVPVRTVAPVG